MSKFTPLDRCLACGGSNLRQYADFGSQPLANDFHLTKAFDTYPLGLRVCLTCYHSQQLGAVDPDTLYRDYPYVSGTSDTLKAYFRDFAQGIHQRMCPEAGWEVGPPLRVLEIASNDGTLLTNFKQLGHEVLGVDPAKNLRRQQMMNDIPTICGYWDGDTVEKVPPEFQAADVVIAMNVLGHVSDPLAFLKRCRAVLRLDGRIYIQTSQAKMLQNAEFDTCYHEHLSFFTVSSFEALAARAGLLIESIRHVPVHGTSYLVELRAGATMEAMETPSLLLEEQLLGYYSEKALYPTFMTNVNMLIDHAESTVSVARHEGYKIAAYGAAAKGMTFMNVSGIEPEFVVDDSPLKQGKFCPGGSIPVVAGTDKALDYEGDIFWIIFAWNMRGEIVRRISQRRPSADDRFMVVFPKLSVTRE